MPTIVKYQRVEYPIKQSKLVPGVIYEAVNGSLYVGASTYCMAKGIYAVGLGHHSTIRQEDTDFTFREVTAEVTIS